MYIALKGVHGNASLPGLVTLVPHMSPSPKRAWRRQLAYTTDPTARIQPQGPGRDQPGKLSRGRANAAL